MAKAFGVDIKEWEAAFADHVRDIPATRFAITVEDGMIRIAFGRNGGPVDDDGNRASPHYPVALMVDRRLAMQLMVALQRMFPAQPAPEEQKAPLQDGPQPTPQPLN